MDPRGASLLSQFVLDASAVMVLVMDDEPEGPVMPLVHALTDGQAIAPALWDFEVANALTTARRRGRLDDDQLARSLHTVAAMECARERHDADIALLIAMSAEHGVTPYDAAYLSLAIRRGVALATVDRALAQAADAAGVPLVC